MLRRIVKQTESSKLGRKVLTSRKNNRRGNVGLQEQEVAPVAPPAPVVKKKVAKKTSKK